MTTTAPAVLATLSASGLAPVVVQSRHFDRIKLDWVERPERARAGALSWCRDRPRAWGGSLLLLGRMRRGCVDHGIVEPGHGGPWGVVSVDNARLGLLRVLQAHFAGAPAIVRDDGATVHPSAVIGEPGSGYIWTGDRFELIPHTGGVYLGAGVEVGPLATIQRGCIGDTEIGPGSKLGPQVNVGHSARVGSHCLLIAGCRLAGSVELGDGVTVWQGAMIKQGARVGDGSTIAMGAVVLHDVPAGETWAGNPARRAG